MNYFEDTSDYFRILTGLGFVLTIIIFVQTYINKKKKKETFLKLDMNVNFLQTFNFLIILFNSITSFRTEESFLNSTYNTIQLIIFAAILLFFWSGEYVFYQNKKLVKEQYPYVIV